MNARQPKTPQTGDSHAEPSTTEHATEPATRGEMSHDAGIAQREVQARVSSSPQVRRLTQLQEMVDGSPPMVAQASAAQSSKPLDQPVAQNKTGESQGAVVQRIEEGEARRRLKAEEGGSNEAVAVLMLLNAVRDEIPRIEAALSTYEAFIDKYPVKAQAMDQQYPSKNRVRHQIGNGVAKLSANLSSFLEVLDGLEDWYMEERADIRDDQARRNLGVWKQLWENMRGVAGPVAALFGSRPDFVHEIKDHLGVQRITALNIEIRQWFAGAGGFSAVGRAHDMQEVEIEDTDEDVDKGFPVAETYLSGYHQGGRKRRSAADKIDVLNKPEDAVVSNGPAVVEGGRVDHLEPQNPLSQRPERLDNAEQGITPLHAQSWTLNFRAPPAPRDRGDGQYTNMNRTNARGYAWLNEAGGWNNTAWEWLHVQAASLGGATNGTNLVLGTRDANTLMMPFESNIRLLAGLVKSHPELDKLTVTWSVDDGDAHAYKTIGIKWTVVPLGGASRQIVKAADKTSGEVIVANLHTQSNLSKVEVRWVESELSEFRQGLKREDD